jgi:hypothetical protein
MPNMATEVTQGLEEIRGVLTHMKTMEDSIANLIPLSTYVDHVERLVDIVDALAAIPTNAVLLREVHALRRFRDGVQDSLTRAQSMRSAGVVGKLDTLRAELDGLLAEEEGARG